MGEPIALPAGVRLVHIGPHKTGTTALQRAMHRSREALHEQGVHYAYPTVQAYKPAIGLTGLRGRRGGPVAGPEDWNVLVEEVRAAGEMRVVVSSESFANADTEHIEQLRDDLGADRVHVVRMVRRYDKLVPSQWQQQLLNGRRISLDGFCTRLLDPDSSFWLRHGFATLTRRWAEVVGPDNLTVVVVDEDDPRWLLHVFERMLSLRDGTLPLPPGRPNRSLSLAEAETLRKVNVAIAKAGWSDRVIHHYVREGVSAGFKRIPSDARAGRPRLSRDLHERLAAATSRDVDDLLALGVHVVGDVGRLAVPPWQGDDGQGSNGPVTLAPASVASAVLGVVRMAEDPVPLYGTPGAGTPGAGTPGAGTAGAGTAGAAMPAAPVTSGGVRARLRPRRSVTMLAPEGAAGDFARGDGADGPAARGGRAGRVLLTVVPPWQLLAARWQAGLLDGDVTEYAAWLDHHPEAWELPDLLAQARGLATPRRITVVVGDARFPSSWTETAAGVRRGGLSEVRRSLLTWPEAEWLRELNVRAREDGLPDERRRRALAGALRWTLGHQPGPDPGAHPLEGDQLARAQALGRELRTALERARVDVRGDLEGLTDLRPATAPARLAPRPASWPILGAIASADVRRA